jgi:light-regulated signal transduction histidine kinase (bacteriophytochrome)
MKNMGVTASMSIRVMAEGKLWGLISCHHETPKYLTVENRSIFEWLSMEISHRISAVIIQESLSRSAALLQKKTLIIENIYSKGNILNGITEDQNQNLRSLFNATGFLVHADGIVSSGGTVPENEVLDNIILWIKSKSLVNVFHTNNLSDVFEDADDYADVASGMLVIPINPGLGDFIVCFRPEVVKQIKWGGDPNQAINFEKDGKSYHPRNSFKLWLETVHGQSEAWSEQEMETAESLRNFLFEFSTTSLYN